MQMSLFQKALSKSFVLDYIKTTGLHKGTDPSGAEPPVELEVTGFSVHFIFQLFTQTCYHGIQAKIPISERFYKDSLHKQVLKQ